MLLEFTKVTTLLLFNLTLEPSEESRTHANVLHELPTWLTWIIFLCANLCITDANFLYLSKSSHTHAHTHTAEHVAKYGKLCPQRVLFSCCCCSQAVTWFTRTEMQMSYSKGWQKNEGERKRVGVRQRKGEGEETQIGRHVRHVWHIAQLT